MTVQKKRLLWVYCGSLEKSLDKATWIETSDELVKIGWSVTLVSNDYKRYNFGFKHVIISCPTQMGLRILVFHFKLFQFLIKNWGEFDVILMHQTTALFLPLLSLFRKMKKWKPKYVLDSRTVPMDNYSPAGKRQIMIFAIAHRFAAIFADGQTSNTEYMAKVQNVPTSQLLGTWPAGVNLQRFDTSLQKEPRNISEQYPLKLIYIGALHKPRNLLILCKALVRARKKYSDITLTLVGEGDAKVDLEDFANAYGNGTISVLSSVPYDKVPQLLLAADIGVIPFPDTEIFRTGTPIKLFEYLAAGLPVILTRVICHMDYVPEEGVAFWAEDSSEEELAKSICIAYENAKLLPTMGLKAKELSLKYSWSHSAQKLSDALLRI